MAIDIGRRQFIFALGGTAAAWPLTARAQTADRTRRIGFLTTFTENDADAAKRLAAFRLKLHDLGWTEGRNLRIDIRFAENNGERVRQAVTELIALAPDAIELTTSSTTRALLDATADIPIVTAVSGDPVALGFTKSLSHPTGNVTGFTTFNDTLAAKRFELLHEIVPTMHNAALIWVPANPQQVLLETQTKTAAQTLDRVAVAANQNCERYRAGTGNGTKPTRDGAHCRRRFTHYCKRSRHYREMPSAENARNPQLRV